MQDKIDLSSDRTASARGYRSTDEIRSTIIWTRSSPVISTDEIRSTQPLEPPAELRSNAPLQANPPQPTEAPASPHQKGNANHNTPPAPSGNGNHKAGSANESLVPFTTQIRRGLKAEIQRQASGADLSDSAAGAALLEKAIQGSLMKENAAELRPIIQDQIHKDIQRFSNRAANLALEAFYSAEEARMLTIYLLRFFLADDALLEKIVDDVRSEARESLKRYRYASAEAPEGQETYERPPQEGVN